MQRALERLPRQGSGPRHSLIHTTEQLNIPDFTALTTHSLTHSLTTRRSSIHPAVALRLSFGCPPLSALRNSSQLPLHVAARFGPSRYQQHQQPPPPPPPPPTLLQKYHRPRPINASPLSPASSDRPPNSHPAVKLRPRSRLGRSVAGLFSVIYARSDPKASSVTTHGPRRCAPCPPTTGYANFSRCKNLPFGDLQYT